MAEIVGTVGLTGIVLIDIGIGLLFAVLTFSLIASALAEALAGVLNYRGEHLRRGIQRLLRDETVAGEVLSHPLIEGLKGPKNLIQRGFAFLFMWGDAARDPDRMPSSIPKHTFARALIEALVARREALSRKLDDAEDRAERALDLVGLEIERLALDQRLKKRLKALVARIDFDRIEAEASGRLSGVVDRADAMADALGIELDALGVSEAVKAGARAALERAEIGDLDERLATRIEAAVDHVGLEARLETEVRQALARVDPAALRTRVEAVLDGALDRAERALAAAQIAIEAELAEWFDTAMDRVTGWYVRRAKTVLFVIGFVMAAGLGFDLIGYGQQLARDDAMRSAIVARAQAAAASGEVGAFSLRTKAPDAAGGGDPDRARALEMFDADGDGELDPIEQAEADATLRAALAAVGDDARAAIETVRGELGHAAGPIGASFWAADWWTRGRMLLSYLLIGLGCTLGGQFWFDLLKSALRVRAGASGLNSDLEKIARRLGIEETNARG